ncbi:MAG: IS66 family transposase [Parasporobacterium sp.]|nr:IS66 family transposase [Parasporobacterium sp.]
MRDDLRKLSEDLAGMSRDDLIRTAMELIHDKDELLAREAERSRADTEMAIQFEQMKAELDGARKENLYLKKENKDLHDQLKLRKNDLFGCSSERSAGLPGQASSECPDPLSEEALPSGEADAVSRNPDNGSRTSPDDPENGESTQARPEPHAEEEIPVPAEEGDGVPSGAGRGKKGSRTGNGGRKKTDISRLPRRTVFHFNKEELDREYGKGNWRISGWQESEEVIAVRTSVYVRVNCTPVISVGVEHQTMRIPYQEKLLPGSLASPSLVAYIIFCKLVLDIPLYRQEEEFFRQNFPLSRQTMSNWFLRFVPDLFGPVYDRLCTRLLLFSHVHSDETTVEVIDDGRKAGSKSYMWIHTSGELEQGPPITVFYYELTRNTDHLRKFFLEKGYRGICTCDAYAAYDLMEKESNGAITVSGCWMHCRRRFVYALVTAVDKNMDPGQVAALPEFSALDKADAIFDADTPLKKLDAKERGRMRDTEVRPKVDEFFRYLHSLDIDSGVYGGRFSEAVKYALNQEAKLRLFLDDPMIPCDNGYAERAIRPFAVSRRNWLFCYSVDGAKDLAIACTIIETAKANGADPYYYMRFLLEKMPAHMDEKNLEFLDDMMPWSDLYRAYERAALEEELRFFDEGEPPAAPRTPSKRFPKIAS